MPMAFYQESLVIHDPGYYERLHPTPYCALCRRAINNEVCYILCPEYAGDVYRGKKYHKLIDKHMCCRLYSEDNGEEQHDACPIHEDCLALFQMHCPLPLNKLVLDRIWVEGVCQLPWPRMPCLWVDETENLFSMTGVNSVTTDGYAYGQDGPNSIRDLVKGLKSMPQEILFMIYKESSNSPLWRYGTVLDFAQEMPLLETSEDCAPMHLSEVAAWERGYLPTVATEAIRKELPILYITIDARGICSIERLAEHPEPTLERTKNLRYVVTSDYLATPIMVSFCFGHAQLNSNTAEWGILTAWDTPTPPQPDFYRSHARLRGNDGLDFRRFNAILRGNKGPNLWTMPLDQADGLTIFFENGRPHGIHKHTAAEPDAVTTWMRLNHKLDLKEVYMPIAAGDRIVAFGLRYQVIGINITDPVCFIFRTELMGDIAVGATMNGHYKDIYLASNVKGNKSPLSIIYYNMKKRPLSVIGGYAVNQTTSEDPEQPFFHLSRRFNPFFVQTYYSVAPLEDVVHVRIYTNFAEGEIRPFRGMILTYRNGGKRALGSFRADHYPYVDCKDPVFICIRRTTRHDSRYRRGRTLYVEATASFGHEHALPGWDCLPLHGALQMWHLPPGRYAYSVEEVMQIGEVEIEDSDEFDNDYDTTVGEIDEPDEPRQSGVVEEIEEIEEPNQSYGHREYHYEDEEGMDVDMVIREDNESVYDHYSYFEGGVGEGNDDEAGEDETGEGSEDYGYNGNNESDEVYGGYVYNPNDYIFEGDEEAYDGDVDEDY